ncbi:MAG: hypothetical protein AABW59_00295 [archaeon]
MKCKLCNTEIKDYSLEFNHLKVDETRSADLCEECIEKFAKWQGERLARLFPTNSMKKAFAKKK